MSAARGRHGLTRERTRHQRGVVGSPPDSGGLPIQPENREGRRERAGALQREPVVGDSPRSSFRT